MLKFSCPNQKFSSLEMNVTFPARLPSVSPFDHQKAPNSPWVLLLRTASVIPKVTLAGLLLGLVAAVAWIDYQTGLELSVSSLYLAPIALGTWVAGRLTGNIMALASVGAWIVVDSLKEHSYSHWMVPAWNAWMLAISFLVVVALLASLREAKEDRKKALTSLTTALQRENAQSQPTVQESYHALETVQTARPRLQRPQCQVIDAVNIESGARLATGAADEVKNPPAPVLARRKAINQQEQTLEERIRL